MFVDRGLGHHGELDFLSIGSRFDIYHLFYHVSEVVTLLEYDLKALIKVYFFLLDGPDECGLAVYFKLELIL